LPAELGYASGAQSEALRDESRTSSINTYSTATPSTPSRRWRPAAIFVEPLSTTVADAERGSRRQGQRPQAGDRLHPAITRHDRLIAEARARRSVRLPHEPQPAIERPTWRRTQLMKTTSPIVDCGVLVSTSRADHRRRPVEVRGTGCA
jgi:hypothetical protein